MIHFAIAAAVGALVGVVVYVGGQIMKGEKIEGFKILTATLTGAASGALAATGVGIGAAIALNAGISMAGNVADQIYDINVNNKEFDLLDLGISGVVGGAAGVVGGAGGSSNAIRSLSNATTKRITNAVTYQLGKGAYNEIGKAIVYYYKSSFTLIVRDILKSIAMAGGPPLLDKILEAYGMKDKMKSEIKDYWKELNIEPVRRRYN